MRWSGIRESNPRLDLGKVAYYHYTNPAYKNLSAILLFIAWCPWTNKVSACAALLRRPRPGLSYTANSPSGLWHENYSNAGRKTTDDTFRRMNRNCRNGLSLLPLCGLTLPPETSSAARQTSGHAHDQYKPGRISRHRRNKRSLANDGAFAVYRGAFGWSFSVCSRSFSR